MYKGKEIFENDNIDWLDQRNGRYSTPPNSGTTVSRFPLTLTCTSVPIIIGIKRKIRK